MSTAIEVQRAPGCRDAPAAASIRRWARAALEAAGAGGQRVTVRVTGEDEMTRLNAQYRGKATPTNVLAFALPLDDAVDGGYLGDVVVCAPVVAREAAGAGIAAEARWAHMVVHGVLHLCGYDHVGEREARRMEARESDLLVSLGYPDPWPGEDTVTRPGFAGPDR